jgi:hypothetical protein
MQNMVLEQEIGLMLAATAGQTVVAAHVKLSFVRVALDPGFRTLF